MTVAPVQDLIVDVMAAADPVAQRMAAARLERLAPGADQNFGGGGPENRSRRIASG